MSEVNLTYYQNVYYVGSIDSLHTKTYFFVWLWWFRSTHFNNVSIGHMAEEKKSIIGTTWDHLHFPLRICCHFTQAFLCNLRLPVIIFLILTRIYVMNMSWSSSGGATVSSSSQRSPHHVKHPQRSQMSYNLINLKYALKAQQ